LKLDVALGIGGLPKVSFWFLAAVLFEGMTLHEQKIGILGIWVLSKSEFIFLFFFCDHIASLSKLGVQVKPYLCSSYVIHILPTSVTFEIK
jgi:hypothetical protein